MFRVVRDMQIPKTLESVNAVKYESAKPYISTLVDESVNANFVVPPQIIARLVMLYDIKSPQNTQTFVCQNWKKSSSGVKTFVGRCMCSWSGMNKLKLTDWDRVMPSTSTAGTCCMGFNVLYCSVSWGGHRHAIRFSHSLKSGWLNIFATYFLI